MSFLQHPNIVQFYDYGQTDGNYYIVMEKETLSGTQSPKLVQIQKGERLVQDMSLLVFKDDKGYYRLEGDDPNNQVRIDMTEEETDAWIEQHSHRYFRVKLEEALHIIKKTRIISQEFTLLEQCDHCEKPGSPFTFVLPVTHLGKRNETMFEQRACSEACKQAIIQKIKLAMGTI